MNRKETYKLTSKVDGLELDVLVVRPPEGEQVRGVMQLVHGMAEYKERYLPVMEYLAQRGIACVIHDHRGHGKSMRQIEDKGYIYGVGADGIVADTVQVNRFIADEFEGVPVVLFGHSMGSLVARCYLREHDGDLKGLIISGPPTENPAAAGGLLLARLQRTFKGGRSLGKLMESIAFGSYNKKFDGIPYAWVCGNGEVLKAYAGDPLCGFTFTADGYVGLMELLCRTYEKSGWQCSRPELPILFLGGEKDPCIDGLDKFEKAMAHLRCVGYQDVTGKMYTGMRHEICNEVDRMTVFADIAAFLDKVF